jgi:hypothetical protein
MSASRTRTRILATLVATSLSHAGLVYAAAPAAQAAQAAPAQLIGAEQVAQAQHSGGRALLERTLDRADVAAALEARGVSVQAARERVAALTDAEAALVAERIDQAPAAGESVLGVIVFIFVLLLITDILGLTKIYPFTRSVR